MKIKFNSYIGGVPAKLHLSIKLTYGENDEWEKKILHLESSLDEGIRFDVPFNFFDKMANKFGLSENKN